MHPQRQIGVLTFAFALEWFELFRVWSRFFRHTSSPNFQNHSNYLEFLLSCNSVTRLRRTPTHIFNSSSQLTYLPGTRFHLHPYIWTLQPRKKQKRIWNCRVPECRVHNLFFGRLQKDCRLSANINFLVRLKYLGPDMEEAGWASSSPISPTRKSFMTNLIQVLFENLSYGDLSQNFDNWPYRGFIANFSIPGIYQKFWHTGGLSENF